LLLKTLGLHAKLKVDVSQVCLPEAL